MGALHAASTALGLAHFEAAAQALALLAAALFPTDRLVWLTFSFFLTFFYFTK